MRQVITATEVRSVVVGNGVGQLAISDLASEDLPNIAWSGNRAHIRSVAKKLQAVARGEADYLAVRAPDGSPIAKCLVDYSISESEAEIAQLAVRNDLRGLGIGSYLIAAAEDRIRGRGKKWAVLNVDVANPRPRALYERLGYELVGHKRGSWEVEDEAGQVFTYHADLLRLRKEVGP